MSVMASVKEALPSEYVPEYTELAAICGAVSTNSFTIDDKNHDTIGIALYLAGSVFDHSCKPNVTTVFYGNRVMFVSMEDNPKFTLQNAFINYCEIKDDHATRTQFLRKHYHFECQCEVCKYVEDDNLIACFGCRSVANQVDYTYTRLRQNPFCEWCGSRLNREVAGYARMKA